MREVLGHTAVEAGAPSTPASYLSTGGQLHPTPWQAGSVRQWLCKAGSAHLLILWVILKRLQHRWRLMVRIHTLHVRQGAGHSHVLLREASLALFSPHLYAEACTACYLIPAVYALPTGHHMQSCMGQTGINALFESGGQQDVRAEMIPCTVEARFGNELGFSTRAVQC